MRYAIIEDGVVANIVLADAPLEENWVEATGPAQIGGSWDGAVFSAPPVSVVEPVPDYDAELVSAINAATTLEELKAALVGSISGAKARAGGKPATP